MKNTLKKILFVLILLVCGQLYAQTNGFERHINNNFTNSGRAIAIDNSLNTYIGGYKSFCSSINLVKLNPNGILLWDSIYYVGNLLNFNNVIGVGKINAINMEADGNLLVSGNGRASDDILGFVGGFFMLLTPNGNKIFSKIIHNFSIQNAKVLNNPNVYVFANDTSRIQLYNKNTQNLIATTNFPLLGKINKINNSFVGFILAGDTGLVECDTLGVLKNSNFSIPNVVGIEQTPDSNFIILTKNGLIHKLDKNLQIISTKNINNIFAVCNAMVYDKIDSQIVVLGKNSTNKGLRVERFRFDRPASNTIVSRNDSLSHKPQALAINNNQISILGNETIGLSEKLFVKNCPISSQNAPFGSKDVAITNVTIDSVKVLLCGSGCPPGSFVPSVYLSVEVRNLSNFAVNRCEIVYPRRFAMNCARDYYVDTINNLPPNSIRQKKMLFWDADINSPFPTVSRNVTFCPYINTLANNEIDANGNNNRLCKTIFVVGVEEEASQNSTFRVYPNPFNNELVIEPKILNHRSGSGASLKIYNVLGQLQHQQMISNLETNTTMRLNTSDWAKSIYFLQIEDQQNLTIFKTKIIKE